MLRTMEYKEEGVTRYYFLSVAVGRRINKLCADCLAEVMLRENVPVDAILLSERTLQMVRE